MTGAAPAHSGAPPAPHSAAPSPPDALRASPGLAPAPPAAWWLPALLGLAAFLALIGPEALLPWRDGWLSLHADHLTYRLGWLFYRDTPWSFPPAANPRYGIELASSVAYADIIPLLALPMKALSGIHPIGQYFGLWLLLCCLGQAGFAWALLGRLTVGRAARAAGTVVLLFAPFFTARLPLHFALGGQFLLLAALWLASLPDRSGGRWVALVAATALVHPYLLVMVGAVWGADWLRRGPVAAAWEGAAVPLSALAAFWLAGGFALTDAAPWGPGFGAFGMDLLGPLRSGGFSLLLPDLAAPPRHEGALVFLGSGGLLVIGAAAVAAMRRPVLLRPLRRHWRLGLVLLALLLLAVTHRVIIAGTGPHEMPLPDWVLAALEPLRASNRFVWPLLYAVLAVSVVLVARGFRPGVATRVLLLAAALQVGDSAIGWMPARLALARAPAEAETMLASPFWAAARERYTRLRQLPPSGQPEPGLGAGPAWASLADYAWRNGWDTDIAYLARVSRAARAALRAEAAARIAERRWEPGTLYVVLPSQQAVVAEAADPARDLFAEIDGITVLAPGWFAPPR